MTETIIPLIEPFCASVTGSHSILVAPDRRTAHIRLWSSTGREFRSLSHGSAVLRRGDTARGVTFDEYGLAAVHVTRPNGEQHEQPVGEREDNMRVLALRDLLNAAREVEATCVAAEKVGDLFQWALREIEDDHEWAPTDATEKPIRERMAKAVVTWETREDGTVVGTLSNDAPALKAIETAYAGCRFRSRLEARWAVCLTTLGIEWEYEPEGFETAAGWYLPDFRLPVLRKWLEIKPEPVEDLRHAAFAASLDAEWAFIVAAGNIPDPHAIDDPERDCTDLEMHLIGRVSMKEIQAAYTAARSARFEHSVSP